MSVYVCILVQTGMETMPWEWLFIARITHNLLSRCERIGDCEDLLRPQRLPQVLSRSSVRRRRSSLLLLPCWWRRVERRLASCREGRGGTAEGGWVFLTLKSTIYYLLRITYIPFFRIFKKIPIHGRKIRRKTHTPPPPKPLLKPPPPPLRNPPPPPPFLMLRAPESLRLKPPLPRPPPNPPRR